MKEVKIALEQKKKIREIVKQLKPIIPLGSVKSVAEELDLSRQIVSDVLAGRRWNLDILEKLISIGEKEIKRIEKAANRLDKVLEKRKATQK
jgi:hypothetical protein